MIAGSQFSLGMLDLTRLSVVGALHTATCKVKSQTGNQKHCVPEVVVLGLEQASGVKSTLCTRCCSPVRLDGSLELILFRLTELRVLFKQLQVSGT
jgi:hypothetical protein